MDTKLHYVVATAIIIKDGKYLIAKRSEKEKAFPGRWTVPGGKLNTKDYIDLPHDTKDNLWYNILEKLTRREIKEEVDLEIEKIGYVTSLAYIRSDGYPTLIISLYCYYKSGDIKLSEELTEYAWVDLEESKNYDLVDGMYEELEMLDQLLKEGGIKEWEKG